MPPPRPNYGGPKLPSALLTQVNGASVSKRKWNGANNRTAPQTRKDKRKLDREEKRSTRQQEYRKTPPKQISHPIRRRDPQSEDEEEDEELGAEPPSPPIVPVKASTKGNSGIKLKSILKSSTPKSEPKVEITKKPEEVSQRPLSRREKEKLAQEDAEIAALEKRLGIKSKKLPKSFAEDGLDTLLGDIDGLESSDRTSNGKRGRPEDVEWLERKRRKVVDEIASGSEEEEENSDVEEGFEFADGLDDDQENGSSVVDSEDEDNAEVDQPLDAIGSELSESEADDFEGFDSETSEQPSPKRIKENPYVAPGANLTKSTSKYIPPSLRNAAPGDAEIATRLRRQVQGLLNKLSEINIVSILGEVEQLYQSNPRQYVTSTLIDLLLTLLNDRTALNDTFIILHAGFIAAVYKVIGPDFGAQMIERLVSKFDECYDGGKFDETNGKETINLISLLAQLYNLQVIGCELMFDYVRNFLEELSEAHTELLLRVVRSSGSQLRQDDPSSLKDIVLLLQRTISKTGEASLSVRTKFMIETINDLKNNKLKAGAATSAMTLEHLIRMRRILGSLNNRNIKATEPLRIGLSDMRNTDKRGKWWLVGASWKGKSEDQSSTTTISTTNLSSSPPPTTTADDDSSTTFSTDLLSLARASRMNTDIRRAIFITLLSSSDYQDAYLRLLKLNLKRAQEAEIPKVLLHCAGAERAYNPYYTLIAGKLCGERRMRMGFQFALWDLFGRLGERKAGDEDGSDGLDGEGEEVTVESLVNYGKMFGDLVAGGRLGLGVLKNLDLLYLQPRTKTLLEILFVTIFLRCTSPSLSPAASTSASTTKTPKHDDEEDDGVEGKRIPKPSRKQHQQTLSTKEIFSHAILENPGLKGGLLWFLREVVKGSDLVGRDAKKVKVGVKEAVKVLSMDAVGG